jgi:hypothetical protein
MSWPWATSSSSAARVPNPIATEPLCWPERGTAVWTVPVARWVRS